MEYIVEILDRATGELVEVNKGNWITITELGKAHGVGPKTVRAILHHMGLLYPEGKHGRYRLADFAVRSGYGRRVDRSKRSKWPFDVISPEGQRVINDGWATTVADMRDELAKHSGRAAACEALDHFERSRRRELETQQVVCWLRDHYPDLTNADIAKITGVSMQLVGRYVTRQQKQREELRRRVRGPPSSGGRTTQGAALHSTEDHQKGDRQSKELLPHSSQRLSPQGPSPTEQGPSSFLQSKLERTRNV